ncbi:SepM family pheromone-processing serine protease [Pseudalkalibacillus caeni]|uniref:endopeptidase La n=1 Tax=Exobacillus caeni TaxID=2574798 RepID=A0A5R9FDB8_9BACL|nr:SepM family pheromone-processing serine protease [Pseudalkalibacillus caeni]TLS37645.1 PDZ domain-containing protein [Pseudalkalibacillus caeni]
MSGSTKRTVKISYLWVIIIVLAALITFVRLPYYVTTPGEAKALDNVIEVDGGNQDRGEFMLTTVRIGEANIVQYLWAMFNEYHHIYPKEDIRREGETDEEYHQRQLEVMSSSQKNATIVAYRNAGKEVEVINNGVLVTDIIEGMPAEGKLKLGDMIVEVDGTTVDTTEQLLKILGGKEKGDSVTITLRRDGKTVEVQVSMASFPEKFNAPEDKAGIGITGPITATEVKTEPDIKIDTNQIGGPSAGLMFTLEIYNQLTETDYTKGYQIAGTGTINQDGEVGPIGGIKQKIVAADKAKAEVFFAPVAHNNYDDAVEAAKDIETEMKIVPVETFKDALDYLKKLNSSKG